MSTYESYKTPDIPLETVLDESLACVFWFAALGRGLLNDKEYTSIHTVILLGSGADELLGGYVRHRNSFKRANGDINKKNRNPHTKNFYTNISKVPPRLVT